MKKTRLIYLLITAATTSICCAGCAPFAPQLESIGVTKYPDKLTYVEGDYFKTDGMEVKAFYTDNTFSTITDYTYSPSGTLTTNDVRVTVSYKDKNAFVPILVEKNNKEVSRIEITKQPTKTTYFVGQKFDPTGMEVTAYYTDNTNSVVTDYQYTPSGALTLIDENITIGYKGKSANLPITVQKSEERIQTGIEIVTKPTKLNYIVGECFDPTGMVVKETFSDGTGNIITNYTYSPTGALTLNDTKVTVTSGEFHDFVTINVTKSDVTLTEIKVTTQPSKTSYYVGDSFSTNGMVVTAYYSDGSSKAITDYTVDPSTNLQKTNTYVTVSYQGKTATVNITVSEKSGDDYYAGINADSSTLLNDLNKLNSSKRKSTVGYKNMLNNPQQGFYVTDPGDGPNTITTFYSGKSNNGTGGLNREHVWPNSRGGSAVEADIHMPRPTLNAENGSRGNSFYVEGKCKSSGGWDPAMEDFGLESYRGDSARIIFYCAIASTSLTLVDLEDDSTGNKTMGKLSDLLRWNLKYPVLDRELIRNDGAQSLQGNRNPFIDHPEYACKIWGTKNSETRKICGM